MQTFEQLMIIFAFLFLPGKQIIVKVRGYAYAKIQRMKMRAYFSKDGIRE